MKDEKRTISKDRSADREQGIDIQKLLKKVLDATPKSHLVKEGGLKVSKEDLKEITIEKEDTSE